nr:hypothetical protein [Tanacetum cinerariifolium]
MSEVSGVSGAWSSRKMGVYVGSIMSEGDIDNLTMKQYLALTRGVTHDAFMLRVFPITLTGAAKRWVDRLSLGTVKSWDLLKKAFIQRKLDSLGRDMKKLKENVHAIQLGHQTCRGSHLEKECPLNNEVKSMEEVKYGAFRCHPPFNGGNGAKYHVGPPGASVNVIPKSMFEHLKLANLKKNDMLVEIADMKKRAPIGIMENILVRIAMFLFQSDFIVIDMLKMHNKPMILGRPFLATIYAEIDIFNKDIYLGIMDD